MGTGKDDFSFYNSSIWLEYSHKRYLTLEEIRHRLTEKLDAKDWQTLKKTIQETRKRQAIPFYFKTLKKSYWFFQADCITKNVLKIEKLGNKLYYRITQNPEYKEAFINNAATEEAITSAIYEGANSTRAKAKQLIAENRKPLSVDEWMLINNYRAMQWIKENVKRNVDLNLIREIHAIVTRNTLFKDNTNYSGRFRDDVVYIGPHQGIPHQLIESSLLEAIDLTTRNPRYISPLLRGILLHYFIGYIHPFFDGNGRTARTLFYFKAMKNDLKFIELLSISAHLKEHGKRYERAFENEIRHDGDITYFVDFCMTSLLVALTHVERKIEFLLKINGLKKELNLRKTQIMLLQRMALNKFRAITIEEHASNINRSREISRQELKNLMILKLLKEKKQGKKFTYLINTQKLNELINALATSSF